MPRKSGRSGAASRALLAMLAGVVLAMLCIAVWLATRDLATAATVGNPSTWWSGRFRPEAFPVHGLLWTLSHPADWWSVSLGQHFDFAVTAGVVCVVVFGLRWVGRR